MSGVDSEGQVKVQLYMEHRMCGVGDEGQVKVKWCMDLIEYVE